VVAAVARQPWIWKRKSIGRVDQQARMRRYESKKPHQSSHSKRCYLVWLLVARLTELLSAVFNAQLRHCLHSIVGINQSGGTFNIVAQSPRKSCVTRVLVLGVLHRYIYDSRYTVLRRLFGPRRRLPAGVLVFVGVLHHAMAHLYSYGAIAAQDVSVFLSISVVLSWVERGDIQRD
jgi:hypothetical protein